jgi:hypothetical protein
VHQRLDVDMAIILIIALSCSESGEWWWYPKCVWLTPVLL